MNQNELLDLLKQLIALPSVNPGDDEDPSRTGELRMAEFVAGWLAARGFEIEWDGRASGRPNILARWGSKQPRRTLMLEFHLDTVGVGEMMRHPFTGQVEGGRLYGRGACDCKGPAAAALGTLQADVLDALAEADIQLLVAGAMGEEKGNLGAARMAAQGIGADECIVLEPTDLHVVRAHKGALWFAVDVLGLAAHGSHPERGLSAIEGMDQVLELLREQIRADQGQVTHPLLGGPTLNVGTIRGGSAVNIVPDHCHVEVDRRTLPGEDPAQILGRVRAGLVALQQAGKLAGSGVRVLKDSPPFQAPEPSALCARLIAACRHEGQVSTAVGVSWHSDAGAFARTCRDIVVFGPGSIRQAHTADEYIEIDELYKGYQVLRRFLLLTARGETGDLNSQIVKGGAV